MSTKVYVKVISVTKEDGQMVPQVLYWENKDGGTTAVATGATLNISAGDITNKATYTEQLEA